jgi:hypothetical protein
LTLNFEVHDVGSVRMNLVERMWWGYGRIFEGVRGCFQVIPNLRWAPRLDFGMIYDVGIWPLRKPFQMYMVLLAQSMLLGTLWWFYSKEC